MTLMRYYWITIIGVVMSAVLLSFATIAEAQRTIYVNPPQTFTSTCPDIELQNIEPLLRPGERRTLRVFWKVDHRGFTSDVRVRGDVSRGLRTAVRETVDDMRCETDAPGSMSFKDSQGMELVVERPATTAPPPERTQSSRVTSTVGSFGNSEFDKAVAAFDNGDYVTAARIWKRLAEEGSAASAYNYAELLLTGQGVSRDYRAALEWFIKAAENNESGAYERAVGIATELSGTGDPFVDNALGNFYYYGDGVTRDYSAAAEHYRRAAEEDYIPAIVNLARLYDKGDGVTRDYQKSTELYLRAARMGDMESIYNLGVSYAEGMGIPKDHVRAYALFNYAASKGDHEAGETRNKLEDKMPMSAIMEAQQLTRILYDENWEEFFGGKF